MVLQTYCHRQQDQQNNHLVDLWTYLAVPTNNKIIKVRYMYGNNKIMFHEKLHTSQKCHYRTH